jgi:hypothetical protein
MSLGIGILLLEEQVAIPERITEGGRSRLSTMNRGGRGAVHLPKRGGYG